MKINICSVLLFLIAVLPLQKNAFAQIDLQCNSRDLHSVYLVCHNAGFYRIDSVDTNPTDPILLSTNTYDIGGISINNNLDSLAGPVTMYGVGHISGDYYWYWNGSGWSNSGHAISHPASMNPGGSSQFIFNLNDASGAIYRYDGTKNDTLLLCNLGFLPFCIIDVAVDKLGTFYLFYNFHQQIIAYDPSGIPIDTYTTSGFPQSGGGGFAILGKRFYAYSSSPPYALYEGVLTGHNINFTPIKTLTMLFDDMAACPNAAEPLAVFNTVETPHLYVYPNPVKDIAKIKFNNTKTIEISDCLGTVVETISVKGLSEYAIDVNKWKAGVYLIKAISANNSMAYTKIIVQ